MLEKIRKLLEREDKVRFWEFRREEYNVNNITAWNKEVKDLNSGARAGFSIRVLYGNGWGFVYSDVDKYKDVVKRAVKIAKAMDSGRELKTIFFGKSINDKKSSSFKINPSDVSIEEKKKLLLEHSNDEKIKSLQVSYSDANKATRYANSIGSDIIQELTYTTCSVNAIAQNERIESYDARIGGLCGYEITTELAECVEAAQKKAVAMLSTKLPKGGVFPVICDGGLTDVFIHEALGHACEGDIVAENGSCLKSVVGAKVAPDYVNVYDDSTLKNEWGSFFYDDEGIKAQKTQLIKSGILMGFMHSRTTAPQFKAKPTGNARAQGVKHIPLVRMSNTYLEKGRHSFEEMLKDVKKGFYLKGSKGGQVDPATGNFQFNAMEGYIIKDGELKDHVRGVSLAGNTLKILHDIKMISNKYEKGLVGYCGKGGQFVPVKGDCPSILIKRAVVGGK